MAYATQADLIERFGEAELAQVADLIGNGEADATVIARALADADAEIDAALLGRYALPLATVPVLLTRIACDLARESLYADHPTKEITDRAERVRQLLKGIAAGKMRLDAAAAQQEQSGLGLVEMVSGRRTSPFGG
jgi:phage gp36-like protein